MLETAADVVDECQRGDGFGENLPVGTEKKLSGLYSKQQCMEAVRSQFPGANGFTFGSWSSYGSCGTKCECYAEFHMEDWDNKRTWESCKFNLEIQGCTTTSIWSEGFPNPSFNSPDDSWELSYKGNKDYVAPGNKDYVLYNRRIVFEKGDQCIWFANDGYWHMGYCNNLGGNSVYILKKRNMECPSTYNEGSWFSGNRNLGASARTGDATPPYHTAAGGDDFQFYSSAASLTYQVRDGRYYQRCCWKKCRGNWLCRGTPRNGRCTPAPRKGRC